VPNLKEAFVETQGLSCFVTEPRVKNQESRQKAFLALESWLYTCVPGNMGFLRL
jgi:hypothetical protein